MLLQFPNNLGSQRWLSATNVGVADIPLGGVAEVAGYTAPLWQVQSPTETGGGGKIMFAGAPMAAGSNGPVTYDFPAWARVPDVTVARDRLAVVAGQEALRIVDGTTVLNNHAWFGAWADARIGSDGGYYAPVAPGNRVGDLLCGRCPMVKMPRVWRLAYVGTPPPFPHGDLFPDFHGPAGSLTWSDIFASGTDSYSAIFTGSFAFHYTSFTTPLKVWILGKAATTIQCVPPMLTWAITPADCITGPGFTTITGTFTATEYA